MFLNITYFKGFLHLPDLEVNTNRVGVGNLIQTVANNSIEYFIEKYESEYLIKLLGYDFYQRFTDGLKSSDNQIWLDLKEIIFNDGERFSFSPAANYIYFKVKQERYTTLSSSSVVEKTDNAIIVSDRDKLVKVWNEMCDKNKAIHHYLAQRKEAYNYLYSHHMNEVFIKINTFDI